MLYAEKTTVVLKFTEASIEGQNGVVVRRDSLESSRIFVPSPQSMVPLHSLLDMKARYAERLSAAVSVVQMSCDNYYHWTMECLVRSLSILTFAATLTHILYSRPLLTPLRA